VVTEKLKPATAMSVNEMTLHGVYVLITFGSSLMCYALRTNPKNVPQYKYLIQVFIGSVVRAKSSQ
jgi:hypothetical protein